MTVTRRSRGQRSRGSSVRAAAPSGRPACSTRRNSRRGRGRRTVAGQVELASPRPLFGVARIPRRSANRRMSTRLVPRSQAARVRPANALRALPTRPVSRWVTTCRSSKRSARPDANNVSRTTATPPAAPRFGPTTITVGRPSLEPRLLTSLKRRIRCTGQSRRQRSELGRNREHLWRTSSPHHVASSLVLVQPESIERRSAWRPRTAQAGR